MRGLLVALLGAWLAWPAGMAVAAEGAVAARVNGVEISRQRVERGMQTFLRGQGVEDPSILNPEQRRELGNQVLNAMIAQELLWQDARARKHLPPADDLDKAVAGVRGRFGSDEEFRARLKEHGFDEAAFRADIQHQLAVRIMIEKEIAGPLVVSDADIQAFYDANAARFVQPEEIHTRHILVRVEESADEKARAAAKTKIEKALTEARRKNADFAAIAKKYSEDSSAAEGGDLGFVARGQFVQPYEDAAFALKPGQISGVVQTEYGYHVIKLEARRGGEQIALKDVSDRIRSHIAGLRIQEAVQSRVEALRAAAKIELPD